jgi:hypothetical protein
MFLTAVKRFSSGQCVLALFASSMRLLDGLKFGPLPALAIGLTVCLVLEFGIRLLDRFNGPVFLISFCGSTKEADSVLAREDTNLPLAVVIVEL